MTTVLKTVTKKSGKKVEIMDYSFPLKAKPGRWVAVNVRGEHTAYVDNIFDSNDLPTMPHGHTWVPWLNEARVKGDKVETYPQEMGDWGREANRIMGDQARYNHEYKRR